MFLLLQNKFSQVWNQSSRSCTRNGSLLGRTLGTQPRTQLYQTDSGNAVRGPQCWSLDDHSWDAQKIRSLIFTLGSLIFPKGAVTNCWEPELGASRSCTCSLIWFWLRTYFQVFPLLTLLWHALTSGSKRCSLLFSCDWPSAMGSLGKAHQELQAFSTSLNQDI